MRRWFSWLGVVKPAGWTVLGLAALAALLATRLHWAELTVIATLCVLVPVLSLPFLLGRTQVSVDLRLEPLRVTAGDSVAADVTVTNLASSRLMPTLLELPVGPVVHRYGVPPLAADHHHREDFVLRTDRRGVIPVGPASTRRGDPLGLFSRDLVWTPVVEVLVRPVMVPLASLGAGLLRDLEGVSTEAISQSDLAFHALREYVPGDELKHVHWRSSAKVMGAAGRTELLVRQYLDTRRSHATVVVDDDAATWIDPEGFEIAMSVAGSLAVRAVLDEFDTSFMCGDQAVTDSNGHAALDAVCRATVGTVGLVESAHRAAMVAPDTSLLFLISSPAAPLGALHRAAAAFPPEVRKIALVVDPSIASKAIEADGIPVLQLADKNDLGQLLRWSVK